MIRQVASVALLAIFVSVSGRAQIGRATILGSVVDSSDAPVAGASIRITQLETNSVHTTNTNEFGLYAAPNLPVGRYEVVAAASGFKRSVRSALCSRWTTSRRS